MDAKAFKIFTPISPSIDKSILDSISWMGLFMAFYLDKKLLSSAISDKNFYLFLE